MSKYNFMIHIILFITTFWDRCEICSDIYIYIPSGIIYITGPCVICVRGRICTADATLSVIEMHLTNKTGKAILITGFGICISMKQVRETGVSILESWGESSRYRLSVSWWWYHVVDSILDTSSCHNHSPAKATELHLQEPQQIWRHSQRVWSAWVSDVRWSC